MKTTWDRPARTLLAIRAQYRSVKENTLTESALKIEAQTIKVFAFDFDSNMGKRRQPKTFPKKIDDDMRPT